MPNLQYCAKHLMQGQVKRSFGIVPMAPILHNSIVLGTILTEFHLTPPLANGYIIGIVYYLVLMSIVQISMHKLTVAKYTDSQLASEIINGSPSKIDGILKVDLHFQYREFIEVTI